jgi:hypothetical protein
MSRLGMVVAIAMALSITTAAAAQGKRSASKGPIVLPDTLITGHTGLCVEVARIAPVLARADFKRPLISKVEDAAYKEPF